jgi:hypothetical protein
MRDYLVFQLYGPLAAWGDIAREKKRGRESLLDRLVTSNSWGIVRWPGGHLD